MAAELLTPVQYANRVGDLRPQMVYNWIKKQGAPVHYKNGRPYVKERELNSWRKDKETRKKTRATKAAFVKDSGGHPGRIPKDYLDKLASFGGERRQHYCENCVEETEFHVDITYTGFITENHIRAFCLKCKLNHREVMSVTNERMQEILDDPSVLDVPGPDDAEGQRRVQEAVANGLIDEFGNPIDMSAAEKKRDEVQRCFDCNIVLVLDEEFDAYYCPKCESLDREGEVVRAGAQ